MTRRQAEKCDETIAVRIPGQTAELLRESAGAAKRTTSDVIREIIQQRIEQDQGRIRLRPLANLTQQQLDALDVVLEAILAERSERTA